MHNGQDWQRKLDHHFASESRLNDHSGEVAASGLEWGDLAAFGFVWQE
jgi:hypothetical protein